MKTTTVIEKSIIPIFVCSSVLFIPLVSKALTVEEITNPRQEYGGWVTDMADILSKETETELNSLIGNLEQANGTEIAVVTVPETAPSASPKAFATELFNYWGIGKADLDNGILFLISFGDNRVEIETGTGIEDTLPDAWVSNIINTQIIPQYKQDNFDRGTLDGTKALITSLDSAAVAGRTWHWSVLPLLGLGLAVFTGGFICYGKRRSKVFVKPGKNKTLQRTDSRTILCAKCHQPMERTKNINLTQAQQVAQKLGGVSYRGYQCPRCSQDTKSYSIVAYFSSSDRFEDCPHCQELTVTKTGEVLEAATRDSKGKLLSQKKCHCCNYQTAKITSIPRLAPAFFRDKGHNSSGNSSHHYYDSGCGYDGGGDSLQG